MKGSQTEQVGYEWIDQLGIPEKFTSADYEYGADRQALNAFKVIPGSAWLPKQFLKIVYPLKLAGLLGNAVQVSERQFPEIHRLVVRSSQILGITPPSIYLLESPEVNAFTFGQDENNAYIFLQRGLLQASSPRELAFVIGHEMGHIKSQHVIYRTLAHLLINTGLSVADRVPIPEFVKGAAGILGFPAQLALLAWARRSEITADRVGLIACQDLPTARKALALLALGSRDLADRIDPGELERQQTNNCVKWAEMLNEHPYLPARLEAIRLFGQSHFYLRRVLRDPKPPCLDTEDLERAVAEIFADKPRSEPRLFIESDNENRLKVLMAFAAAWDDKELSKEEEKALKALIEEFKFDAESKAALTDYFTKAPDLQELEKELRHFKGNTLVGVAYAFSLLSLDHKPLSRSKKRCALDLMVASGIEQKAARALLDSVAKRKRLFADACGVHLCANCAKVYEIGLSNCPSCGLLSTSLCHLEEDSKNLICARCGVILSATQFSICPMCGLDNLAIPKTAIVVS